MFLFFQTWEKDADCVIFLFSFVDRGSFEEISQHITRMAKPKTNFAKLVIGTKYLLSFKIPRDTCYSFNDNYNDTIKIPKIMFFYEQLWIDFRCLVFIIHQGDIRFPWPWERFDQHAHSEVTQRDIRDFEHTWKIPILKIRNVPDTETKNDLNEISQILATISEHLWQRDIMLAGRSIPTSDGKISSCWEYRELHL